MSGGSLNYFYCQLEEYTNSLGDRELNDLVKDLAKVFHDKEWADSGDTSNGEYNKTVKWFKDKWFTKPGQNERHRRYIDEAIKELERTLGLNTSFCKDCAHWDKDATRHDKYGRCEFETCCLTHGYETPCDKFETRKPDQTKEENK